MTLPGFVRRWFVIGRWRDFRVSRQELLEKQLASQRNINAGLLREIEELRAEGGRIQRAFSEYHGLPGLAPAELERVAMLAEECGEVVQICGKILRFGYESCSPFDSRCKPNRSLLEREVGDLRAVIDLLVDRGDIEWSEVAVWRKRKRSNLTQWTRHQGFGGDGNSGGAAKPPAAAQSSAQ